MLLLCAHLSVGQEPSHFFHGEDKLATINIYDLIQDKQKNYWLATDEGLIKYDGYEYTHITNSEIKSQSVFNLRMDSKGYIYCNNLNNQVFRIFKDRMELFYTVPEYEGHHNVFLDIGPADQLYIQTQGLTIIHENRPIQHIEHDLALKHSRISMHVLSDGTCLSNSFKDLFVVKNGVSAKHRIVIDGDSTKSPALSAWVSNKSGIYAIDQNTNSLYRLDSTNLTFSLIRTLKPDLKGSAIRVYQSNNYYWVVGNKNGAYVYDSLWQPLFEENCILNNHFISDVYTNQENATLLSTFGNGIMIIPDMDAGSVSIPAGKLQEICTDGDSLIFLGNSLGEVYQYSLKQHNISLLYKPEDQKPIEYMAYWPDRDLLFFTSTNGFIQYDLNAVENQTVEYDYALKHMAFSDNYALVALNKGVKLIYPTSTSQQSKDSFLLIDRAYGVSINEKQGNAYAIMSSGLRTIKGDTPGHITYQDQNIYASAIATMDDLEYVGTHNNTLMVLENGRVLDHIKLSSPIEQLEVYNNRLYTLSNNKLYQLSKDYSELLPLETIASTSKHELQDFLVLKDRLYYAIDNVLGSVSMCKPESDQALDILSVTTYVNDMIKSDRDYGHDENELTFKIHAPTLRFQNQAIYQYKLEGYDDQWEQASYHNNTISYKKLPPGTYKMRIKTSVSGKESEEWTYTFKISEPFYFTRWFAIVVILTIVATVSLVYLIRIRQLRKKAQLKLEQQEIRTDLLEMELKALRSQMNPHFIFNSLNSIQNLVLKEDIDNSYDYLVLFAKLVRATLNYSDLSFIPIHDEIEFLETYLSLERLRFKDNFDYSIEYDGEDHINVPPLIIQPFVENAIVHGLMHSDGPKKLMVKLKMTDKLECVIEDNGVGRKRSKEINSRRNPEHRSFAMNAMKQRLELMNRHLNTTDGGYSIIDLVEGENALGTRVELTLPIKFNY